MKVKTFYFLCCLFAISCILGNSNPWDCNTNTNNCKNPSWYLNDRNKPMPWYFESNQVEKAWGLIEGKGKGVIVHVIDSEINFNCPLLKGKEIRTSYHMGNKTTEGYEEIAAKEPKRHHGTSMATVIAASYGILTCGKDQKSFCNQNGDIVISGIAPDVKIINEVYYPKGDLQEAIIEAKESINPPNNALGKPVRAGHKQAIEIPIGILNISGGIKSTDKIDKADWVSFIKRQIRERPNMLFVAAVGNDSKHFSKKNSTVMPGELFWKDTKTPDNIIRVGAINYHKVVDAPKRVSHSNYGKKLVDIMSPGYVPSIDSSCRGILTLGTSDTTAIVSGAIALMLSCNPDTTAKNIKHIFLNITKKYPNLSTEVFKGRVLDIYKAVEIYCEQYYNESETDEL